MSSVLQIATEFRVHQHSDINGLQGSTHPESLCTAHYGPKLVEEPPPVPAPQQHQTAGQAPPTAQWLTSCLAGLGDLDLAGDFLRARGALTVLATAGVGLVTDGCLAAFVWVVDGCLAAFVGVIDGCIHSGLVIHQL